jgi:hypothetical protein
LVTKYEVKGDRVRYFSAERDDWEELPANARRLARHREIRKRTALPEQSVPEAVQLDKEIEQERERARSSNSRRSPRAFACPTILAYFCSTTFKVSRRSSKSSKPPAMSTSGSKANIFRGALNRITGLKQSIEFEGAHAAVQAHVDFPSLYIKIDADPDVPRFQPRHQSSTRSALAVRNRPPSSRNNPSSRNSRSSHSVPFDRFHIVRTEVKNGKRIVGDVKRQVTGKISQEQHVVKTTITRTSAEAGSNSLLSTNLSPPANTPSVEMIGQADGLGKQGMNLYVWDFGVNAKAPANPNPWKPTPPDAKTEPKPQSPAPAATPN